MGTSVQIKDGIAEVVMDQPPVNALTVAGWFEVAKVLDELSANDDVKVVVLRAEGRGFNAGVDIKEMQNTEGFDALIGANRGCYEACRAAYEGRAPVGTAVPGVCGGGGTGRGGACEIVVACAAASSGWL